MQPRGRHLDNARMKPRCILPGTTYLITRRTTQRLFLLRPSTTINAALRYCLALAQKRAPGVELHAVTFMSNHYHIVLTDKEGELPVFTEELHKLIARCLNSHHARWENFWAGGAQTSHVQLVTSDDVLDKIAYTLANPTEALLVSHGSQWPGVRLYRKGSYVAKKPKFFFRTQDEGGKLPDSLKLELTAPPIGVHEKRADDVVQRAASAREKRLRDEANAAGKSFLGAKGVLRQKIYNAPQAPAPRRGMSPTVACQDKWRRIEALADNAEFAEAHDAAREDFIAGNRDAVFPAGTYRFQKQFGACCAEA